MCKGRRLQRSDVHETLWQTAQVYLLAVQELRHLLPDLEGQWKRLQPGILQALAADTDTVAARMLQLKIWFPQANVSRMVAIR